MLAPNLGSKIAIFPPPENAHFLSRGGQISPPPENAPAGPNLPPPRFRGGAKNGPKWENSLFGGKKIGPKYQLNFSGTFARKMRFPTIWAGNAFSGQIWPPHLYGPKCQFSPGNWKKHTLGKSVHPPICISITSGKKNTVCQVHFFPQTFYTDFEARRPAFGMKCSSF